MKFHQTLSLVLLFALPLVPVQLDGRITYLVILYALVLIPIFLKSLKEKLREKDKSTIFFLIFLSAQALSTIFSINFKQSLAQLILFSAYFIIFISASRVFDSPKSRRCLALVFLLVTSFLSVVSLYNTAILHINNHQPVGVSFMWMYFGHNHLSALLVFAIPIAIYFAKVYSKNPKPALRFPFLTLSLLLLVALYFTFARASQVSLLAALIFVVIIFELISQKVTLLILAISLAAIGIILAGSITRWEQLGFVKHAGLQNNSRIIYWRQALANFTQNPLTGTGPDTFRFINLVSSNKTLKTFYAHNFFLQMLSDAGILGLTSSVGLILSVLWQAFINLRSKDKTFALALFVGLLASTINSLFDFDWQLPAVFLIFWMFSGLFLLPSPKHE